MQTPKRKPGKYANIKPDFNLTQEKFDQLQKKLDKLKIDQPKAIAEVQRLAQMGDFSENAAYQMAKGRLRSINRRLDETSDRLNMAIIIEASDDTSSVNLGHKVTVEVNGEQNVYTILGSAETDPAKNIISHNSPLGLALLGKQVGEVTEIKTKSGVVEVKIIKIEKP